MVIRLIVARCLVLSLAVVGKVGAQPSGRRSIPSLAFSSTICLPTMGTAVRFAYPSIDTLEGRSGDGVVVPSHLFSPCPTRRDVTCTRGPRRYVQVEQQRQAQKPRATLVVFSYREVLRSSCGRRHDNIHGVPSRTGLLIPSGTSLDRGSGQYLMYVLDVYM